MAQTRPKAPALKQPSQSEKPAANRELQIKRLLVIGAVVVIVLAIAVIAGLLILNALSGSRHESVAVAPGLNAATFATVPGDSAFPVGIARTPDGTIYLSALGTDVIYKVAADGSLTPWLKSGMGLNA